MSAPFQSASELAGVLAASIEHMEPSAAPPPDSAGTNGAADAVRRGQNVQAAVDAGYRGATWGRRTSYTTGNGSDRSDGEPYLAWQSPRQYG